MKTLKVLVNKKPYFINFDYDSENNNLITIIKDEKNNLVSKRFTDTVMDELFKGYKVIKEAPALKMLTKEDNPITLYLDSDDVLISALFYKNNDFDNMEEINLTIKKLKREKIMHISTQIASYFLLLAIIINFCHEKIDEKKFNQNIKASYQTTYDNFSPDYLIQIIYQNQYLTDEEKELLVSNQFIIDLVNTPMTIEERTILCYKLQNLRIEEFNIISKVIHNIQVLTDKDASYGYVIDQDYKKNIIHIYEDETEFSNLIKIHEFVHSTQCENNYLYLVEGVTEIVAHEYWDRPILSYHNAIKRIYALTAILGPEVIWNATFSSPEYLEKELSNYLTPAEIETFMNYLKIKPFNQKINEETGIGELDQKIDYYIKLIFERKYNQPFEESITMQAFYNMDKDGNIYFQIEADDDYHKIPYTCFNKNKENVLTESTYQKRK